MVKLGEMWAGRATRNIIVVERSKGEEKGWSREKHASQHRCVQKRLVEGAQQPDTRKLLLPCRI